MSDETDPMPTVPSPLSSREASTDALNLDGNERYVDVEQLGAGGMGEVRLVHDRRLGRDVAIKRLRPALELPEFVERFLREVRVQGQLEHPAVVPVYDLGISEEGNPYFTMKRVRGLTLSQILFQVRAGDPAAVHRFSRWRLLAAFNTVCLAIDAAHSHGVLHRDLKPGNIMLGDFGEVYVLDWGLAKVQGDSADPDDAPTRPRVNVESSSQPTLAGFAMGTPGYMSPEQAFGQVNTLDQRTDVYSLGVFLREIVVATALSGEPDMELTSVWQSACSVNREERYESAGALGHAIEHYLEGARDEARRRTLAERHVAIAEAASLERSEGRRKALQSLGSALALDPTNARALAFLSDVLATAPVETPPEAIVQLDALAAERTRGILIANALRLTSWSIGMVLVMVALGVHSVSMAVVTELSLVGCTLLTWWSAVRSEAKTAPVHGALFGLIALSTLALSIGPLLVVPTLAATHAMLFATDANATQRRLMVAASIGLVTVPAVFQPFGAYVSLGAGTLVMHSPLLRFESSQTLSVLILFSFIPVITPTALVGRLRDAFIAAQRKVVIQAAAFRELIPGK